MTLWQRVSQVLRMGARTKTSGVAIERGASDIVDRFLDEYEKVAGRPLDRRHLSLYRLEAGNQIWHMVSRDEIVGCDVTRIEADAASAVRAYREGGRPLRLVHFGTGAYDDDPRALFDIPEMRSWCGKLFERAPHIVFLIDAPTMDWYLPAVVEIEVKKRGADSIEFSFPEHALFEFSVITSQAWSGLVRLLECSSEEKTQLRETFSQRYRAVVRSHGG